MSFISELSEPIRRSPFYCRPLALLSAVFIVTLFTAQTSTVLSALFIIFIISYSVFILFKYGRRSPLPYLLLSFMLLGQILALSAENGYRRASAFDGQTVEAKVVITGKIYSEAFGSAWECRILTINGDKHTGNAVLEVTEAPDFLIYDTVLLSAEAADARKGCVGAELLSIKAERVYLDLTSKKIETVTNENKKGPEYLLYRLRSAIGARFDGALSSGASAYAKALLIGDCEELGGDFRRDMSAIGISHILSVSGMHTSVIAAFISVLCEKAGTSRKTRSAIVCIAVLVFMAAAGFSSPVVRSAIMLVLSVVPVYAGRRGDSVTALFLSGFIICMFSPETAVSCSFLLSFSASLSLVVTASYFSSRAGYGLFSSRAGDLKKGFAVIRKILLSVTVSLCASLITVPVLSLYFSETSFVAVLTNLVALPCATVAMALALLLLVFSGVPGISQLLSAAFNAIYAFTEGFAELIAGNFETSVSLSYPFFVPVLILLFCIFLFLRLRGVRHPAALIAPFVFCAVVFTAGVQIYGAATADRNEAVYLADKSSEGFLICSGSKTLYIDIGRGGKSLPTIGLDIAKTRYCETKPDAIMLTHYHADHISTLKRLVPYYRVKTVYIPYPETDGDRSVLAGIEKTVSGCELVMYARGEEISFGGAVIETQPFSVLERSAHPVVSLGIRLGKIRIFYAGSSLEESEAAYFAERKLGFSDAVISGGHGPVRKEEIRFYSVPAGCPVYVSPYAGGETEKLFPDADIRFLKEDGDGLVRAVFGEKKAELIPQASARTDLRNQFRGILPPEAADLSRSYRAGRLFRVRRADPFPARV